jgi:2-oxo-4-hydroxy-4-carboxy--5-ureidoimidazoline (OHCU) decarboxylase
MSDRSRFVLLADYLMKEDLPAFIETVSGIFSSIPYKLETRRDEAYFHTVFYLMVSASGVNANSEVMSSEGRIDLVLDFPDKVYVIEFKCNQSAKAALKQIHDKGYANKFRQSGKKVILMGVNFDSDKRNVAEWETEGISY